MDTNIDTKAVCLVKELYGYIYVLIGCVKHVMILCCILVVECVLFWFAIGIM